MKRSLSAESATLGLRYTHHVSMQEPIDFEDPKVEEDWCEQQREHVAWFIGQQPIQPGRIGEWPAFHIAPHVAIWAIESGVKENLLGWWVITGDLPTDYFSAMALHHPREVLRAAADRWEKLLHNIRRGLDDNEMTIAGLENNPELQEILRIRIGLLRKTAEPDDFWIQFDKNLDEE